MLFSYLISVVILLLFCAHCLYARALLFTHTLTRSLSDDPGFARADIGQFVSTVQLFDETVRDASRRAGASPYSIPVFLSFFPSYYFLILFIPDSFVIPVLYSYDSMHGCLYVLLQWPLTHYSINYFGLLKA